MNRRALVVNVSAAHYNLGAAKLADYLREHDWDVTPAAGDPGLFSLGYDLVAISVIFSWHAPRAREIALCVKEHSDVWCGGPGMFSLGNWWQRETGLACVRGLDQRFERQRGQYRMTFASRGCPVNCSWCIVPRLEGLTFTLYEDFEPAPILCDNNLSALPGDFQEHIIQRYTESGMTLRDANSGFEPRSFTEETYRRWKPCLRGPWRFAFDEQREAEDVQRMMGILRAESPKRKQVYVLIGNEPMASCYERVCRVIEWGGEPYCQPMLSLNYLGGPIRVHYDWTERRLRDFARWANRHLWRYMPPGEYSNRKNECPPFAEEPWAQYRPYYQAAI